MDVVIVDCAKGTATQRAMTAEETAAHQQLQTAIHKAQQEQQTEDTARDNTLAVIAQKVGVSADELRGALRIGPPQGKKPQ